MNNLKNILLPIDTINGIGEKTLETFNKKGNFNLL